MRWPHIKLGEMCEVITKGTTPTSVGFKFQESGINFVKVESIKPDGTFIPKKFAYIDCECHESFSRSQLQVNDILFSIAGALGRTAIVTEEILPANTNQALAVVRLKNDAPVCYEYLFRALNSSFAIEQIHKHSGGVAQQNLSLAQIKSFEIPVPPLAEQKQIVDILDEAFTNIDHACQLAERNLKNARELFDSTLNQIFTKNNEKWSLATIGEISSIKGGKRLPKGEKLSETPTPYRYIRVSDFNEDGTIDQDKVRYISEHVHKQIKNYIIRSSDLYISIAGTIGKTGIVPKELDGANLTENACRLVLKDKVDNKFIYYFTRSKSFQEQAGFNTRTTAQPKLALSRLASIELNIPPHNEQLEIVECLDLIVTETQRLEKIYQKKITALDELKQSLLQKAFRGELTQAKSAA